MALPPWPATWTSLSSWASARRLPALPAPTLRLPSNARSALRRRGRAGGPQPVQIRLQGRAPRGGCRPRLCAAGGAAGAAHRRGRGGGAWACWRSMYSYSTIMDGGHQGKATHAQLISLPLCPALQCPEGYNLPFDTPTVLANVCRAAPRREESAIKCVLPNPKKSPVYQFSYLSS